MKKNDLKKMALMGITGGIMLASQSAFANEPVIEGTMLAHGCSSCGGKNQSYSSCGGQQRSQGYSSGCNAPTSAGCGNRGSRGQNLASCGGSKAGCGGNKNINTREIAESDFNPSTSNSSTTYQQNQRAGQQLTEQELKAQLDPQGKTLYDALSPEGKALALKMASHACKGQNDCKGQGSCKSAEHSCKGQNDCKGKSGCAFKNKNDAVKVAAAKMAEKRGYLQNNRGSQNW